MYCGNGWKKDATPSKIDNPTAKPGPKIYVSDIMIIIYFPRGISDGGF
jgi:hypothetical protein